MKYKELIRKLTLEEKLHFLTGIDMNATYPLKDLGIERMQCHDGPFGVRMPVEKNEYASEIFSAFPNCAGNREAVATAFPTGCALGATWNRELLDKVGNAIGNEHKAYGVNVMLGPAVNIKRHPLCGRNFEYFSEDPVLSGELGAAYVEGVQKNNIAACPKHFIANNQERGRFSVSSEIDERTMREIYLEPFRRIVKKSNPWAMMCSYNRINGIYASESKFLMDEVLRKEWGFDGVVVSDWDAVKNRAYSLKASLDLCMPYKKEAYEQLMEAYKERCITDEMIDEAVDRLLILYDRTGKKEENVYIDFENHHKLAVEAAREAVTLLKNQDALPLKADDLKRLIIVGKVADFPYIGGDGSSRVKNPVHKETPLEEIRKIVGKTVEIDFWGDDRLNTYDNEIGFMEGALCSAMEKADAVLIFAGQDYSCYSETMDRNNIELEPYMEHTIRCGRMVGKKVIVVLNIGSAVSSWKWDRYADAILVSWLGGQGMSQAVAETIFGMNNPSGKLAETFPRNIGDVLSLKNYPGDFKKTEYNEKLMVGYRHFDTNNIEPEYEFGFGLSYTTFAYSDLQINGNEVSFTLKNIGNIPGKETAQLYLGAPEESWLSHPLKELKAFEKVELMPGEEKRIVFHLEEEDFKFYNIMLHDWIAEEGEYRVWVGASSRNLPLYGVISKEKEEPYTFVSDLY